ncbi:S26 family signal peptidase [Micromonospora sp. NPDC005686]|uniref:S26 family signal peptidase n=1 Tax=unclassified Micromonospora TaxID=2617518 RepID=UPI0033AB9456
MTGLWLAVPVCVAVGAVVLARRRLLLVQVQGQSMEPTLRAGSRVLARRMRGARPVAGQVVVVGQPPPWRSVDSWQAGVRVGPEGFWPAGESEPDKKWIVKRVAATEGEPVPPEFRQWRSALGAVVPAGQMLVLGDNPDRSFDSRRFGYVATESVLGVVLGSP